MFLKVRIPRIIQKGRRTMNHKIEIIIFERSIPCPRHRIVRHDDEIQMAFVFRMAVEDLLPFGGGANGACYGMAAGDELVEDGGCNESVCAC